MINKTYKTDLDLFKELGFKTFDTESREKFFVGSYELPNYQKTVIKISVTCLPAQCWEFEIRTSDKEFIVETGSGALSSYWQTAILIAEGLITIK